MDSRWCINIFLFVPSLFAIYLFTEIFCVLLFREVSSFGEAVDSVLSRNVAHFVWADLASGTCLDLLLVLPAFVFSSNEPQ